MAFPQCLPGIVRIAIFVTFLFLPNGCATKAYKVNQDFTLRPEARKVLLMPMDIELSSLTAGGVRRPEAEWTANAKVHVETAIRDILAGRNIECLLSSEVYGSGIADEMAEMKDQMIKLHEVVGRSILLHRYAAAHKLPGKAEKLDWSLGPESRFMSAGCGAGYALFVCLRDSYATAGRIAEAVLLAVLGIPTGTQAGYASLVDLETGDVIWFNRLRRATGDLRTKDEARSSAELLLSDFPWGER